MSKRKIQVAVTSAVALFFCLVTTLLVMIAVRINQERVEADLRAREEALAYALQYANEDATYLASQKYIDEYGLKHYGRGKGKDIIFN